MKIQGNTIIMVPSESLNSMGFGNLAMTIGYLDNVKNALKVGTRSAAGCISADKTASIIIVYTSSGGNTVELRFLVTKRITEMRAPFLHTEIMIKPISDFLIISCALNLHYSFKFLSRYFTITRGRSDRSARPGPRPKFKFSASETLMRRDCYF